jgi:hypothetical protein
MEGSEIGGAKRMFKRFLPRSIMQRVTPRDVQCLCIGTPKSGTTSIARMCLPNLRAGHESERRRLVHAMHAHSRGAISDDRYVRFLRNRDRELWLEVESNCFLGYRPDLVMHALPEARFIVPIREPLSWLRSMIHNHLDFRPRPGSDMEAWHAVFFPSRGDPHHPAEEALLGEQLYPIHAYLQYWATHNDQVLGTVCARPHLILETGEISAHLDDIASFLSVATHDLNPSGAHSNRTATKSDVLAGVDPEFLSATIARVCSPVISDYRLQRLFSAA